MFTIIRACGKMSYHKVTSSERIQKFVSENSLLKHTTTTCDFDDTMMLMKTMKGYIMTLACQNSRKTSCSWCQKKSSSEKESFLLSVEDLNFSDVCT